MGVLACPRAPPGLEEELGRGGLERGVAQKNVHTDLARFVVHFGGLFSSGTRF
jgi:hypothetical protein